MIIYNTSLKLLKRMTYIRGKAQCFTTFPLLNKGIKYTGNEEFVDEALDADKEFQAAVDDYFHIGKPHNCLIIQPYVKWGPQKKTGITPDEQLDEAISLVKTLQNWTIEETLSVPLENLDKKTLFKSGNLQKIRDLVRGNVNISAVFVNISMLKKIQLNTLQEEFKVLILDRYRIVMQILKTYATTKHAKLQVAMAELYFLQKTVTTERIFPTANPEKLKLMIQTREQKLKTAIKQLRSQRELLRNKRREHQFPIIAVVGYTNAGKTSIIKTLTGEASLIPKDQLFATLDVTMHQGILPSGLNVLYVDTVGFISDIPTNLIECFVATLEDAILADVILHIEDLSSSCFEYKRNQVLTTLSNLANQVGYPDITKKMISVGNKCDLIKEPPDPNLLLVSTRTEIGIEALRFKLESAVITNTSRKIITIKMPSGGDEIRWLRKNATLISETPDESDVQFVKARIIITDANFRKFKHRFL